MLSSTINPHSQILGSVQEEQHPTMMVRRMMLRTLPSSSSQLPAINLPCFWVVLSRQEDSGASLLDTATPTEEQPLSASCLLCCSCCCFLKLNLMQHVAGQPAILPPSGKKSPSMHDACYPTAELVVLQHPTSSQSCFASSWCLRVLWAKQVHGTHWDLINNNKKLNF